MQDSFMIGPPNSETTDGKQIWNGDLYNKEGYQGYPLNSPNPKYFANYTYSNQNGTHIFTYIN